jgi:hypothetical protein
MPRKLKESWLTAFDEWTLPRSEAPASMIHWAGIFAIAAVAKRKVWMPKELMGSYTIYPALYLLYVAEPGVVRKSTSVGYAEELLRDLGGLMNGEKVVFAGDVTSHSKLISALADSPDSSLVVMASEFSNLVTTSKEAMYEVLTRLFDNPKNYDWSTWAHGDKPIKDPVVNLFGATTPKWLSTQPPEHFLGGGFASRLLIVYEAKRRLDRLYYHDIDHASLKEIGKRLVNDLNHISSIKGPFSHENRKTMDYCEDWYQAHVKKEAPDERMTDYFQRKHIHLHKLAMILSLAERDDRKITIGHWDGAVKLLEESETKIPKAFTSMGKNPMGNTMDQVLDWIAERPGISKQKILQRFYRDVQSLDQLSGVLAFLVAAGKLDARGSTNNPKYHAVTVLK